MIRINFRLGRQKTLILFILVLLLAILVIYWRKLYIFQTGLNQAGDIATVIAIIGVIIAYIDYSNRKRDSRKQALLALKSQLEVIGIWSGYSGTGYHEWEMERTISENLRNWGNPFSEVFKTEATAIQTIWLTAGIIELPKDILEKIAPLNQEITTFNTQIDNINIFRLTGDQDLKIKIHLKLNGAINEPLTEEEDRFSKKLAELYAGLHFNTIGNEFKRRLHYKHKVLLDLILEELKKYE